MITQTTGQHRAEESHKGLEACGMNIVAEFQQTGILQKVCQ